MSGHSRVRLTLTRKTFSIPPQAADRGVEGSVDMASRDSGLVLVVGCVIALVWAGCAKKKPGDKKTADKAAPPKPALKVTRKAVSAWIPKAAAGWAYTLSEDPKVYRPDTLHKLLNGGADMYVDAGMTAMVHVIFDDKNKKAATCKVQAFMMKDKGKAAALLNNEKDKNWKPLKVGDQGYEDGQGAMFAKGRFFVRIDSPPSKEGIVGCPYVELARNIAGSATLPW
jgi:hypothetical protein